MRRRWHHLCRKRKNITMKTTELYAKKGKTVNLLLSSGAICVLLLGIAIYSSGWIDQELKIKPLVISCALLLIMGALLIGKLRDLNDKSPLVSLTQKSFVGRTAPLTKAFGAGEWVDVKDINVETSGGDRLVVVTLENHEKYTKRLSKMLKNMAVDKEQNEINIMYSASELEESPEQLFELFQSYWKGAAMNSAQQNESLSV